MLNSKITYLTQRFDTQLQRYDTQLSEAQMTQDIQPKVLNSKYSILDT